MRGATPRAAAAVASLLLPAPAGASPGVAAGRGEGLGRRLPAWSVARFGLLLLDHAE